MGLKISNKATPKQIETLKNLDYIGKWDLTTDEAAEVITELFEQRRQEVDNELYDDSNKWEP